MSDKIATKSIRLDGGTQSRAEINNDVVTDYAAEMKAGVKFPAIVVFFDGDNYWCADGFHRVQAALRVNIAKIEADVRQGTRRDAVLYSVGANADHGLRRSNADKRRAVMKLLEDDEWGKWSSYEIAKRCFVSHTFVDNLRSSLATVASDNPGQRTFNTKHGTPAIMQTGNIGSKSVRYERDAEDQTPPDNAISLVYAPPGTPHGYDWTEDDQPIIYGDSFYVADHIKRLVIVWPYSSKDAAWNMYPKLNPVPGTNFHTHMGTMGMYAYLTPEEYAAQVATETAPAPSITDGIPDAPVNTPVVQADDDEADDIDLNDEPPVDDEDTKQLDLPPTTPEQLPFDQPEPNDPDPFADGYEVGPFGRRKITAKPESSVSPEAGAMIDTATSLRELAASLSNKGTDTPISGWEAGQVDVMQGAKQLYAERQNGESAPDEQPAQPVDPRQNAINAFTSSETVEWYTPAIYIKSARDVMGDIDLDPATCAEAQATVKARQFFTKETDGLAQKWHGRVWLNPPYGREEDGGSTVAKWVHKVVTAYLTHEIEQAVILINATADRAWFDELWPFPVCFVGKRIKFYGPNNTNGNPTVGNAFVYLGENVPGFVEEFEQYGPITFSTRMLRRLNVELADVFGELFYEEVTE